MVFIKIIDIFTFLATVSFSLFYNLQVVHMNETQVKNWIKFAKFEEKHGNVAGAREVYERAVDFFGEEYMEEGLFIGFAKWVVSKYQFIDLNDNLNNIICLFLDML